mmetsp:Transcript_11205/g.41056  ORF Transcript_11205/g.41056 Transcript_11205/m.41056 type:complete len:251 (+) Transcript_11205:108-860(+)
MMTGMTLNKTTPQAAGLTRGAPVGRTRSLPSGGARLPLPVAAGGSARQGGDAAGSRSAVPRHPVEPRAPAHLPVASVSLAMALCAQTAVQQPAHAATLRVLCMDTVLESQHVAAPTELAKHLTVEAPAPLTTLWAPSLPVLLQARAPLEHQALVVPGGETAGPLASDEPPLVVDGYNFVVERIGSFRLPTPREAASGALDISTRGFRYVTAAAGSLWGGMALSPGQDFPSVLFYGAFFFLLATLSLAPKT